MGKRTGIVSSNTHMQYSAHLAQSKLKVRKVPDTESTSHSVEPIVIISELHAVSILEDNDIIQACIVYFLTSNVHHTLTDVAARQFGRMQQPGTFYGKVTRTCSNVENMLWLKRLELFNSLFAPLTVNIPRQTVVQLVVGRSNVVEHLLHLFAFLTVAVGFYGFLIVRH